MKAKANILAKPNPYIMVATNAASCLYTLHSLIPDHKPGNVVLSKILWVPWTTEIFLHKIINHKTFWCSMFVHCAISGWHNNLAQSQDCTKL